MKKALFTLDINDYAPEIKQWTFPLLRRYAAKIGADFRIITERRFPEWPVEVEKLQIYELGREYDWNIFVDADALIHPDMVDVTAFLPFDTVAHNGRDQAVSRWVYDDYFRRDGRDISSCNWFTIASRWCLDLWHPPDDLTPEEAKARIFPAVAEINAEVFGDVHLTDDFLLSRNIARYGLKFVTFDELRKTKLLIQERDKEGRDTGNMVPMGPWMWHAYTIGKQAKVQGIKDVLRHWGIVELVEKLRKQYAVDTTRSEVSVLERESAFAGAER